MIRARLSPITVDRRCPTCIGLATLGDEKSMTTVFALRGLAEPKRGIRQERPQGRSNPGVVEPHIQEPGPGHLGRTGQRSEIDGFRDFGSQFARRAPTVLASARQPLA